MKLPVGTPQMPEQRNVQEDPYLHQTHSRKAQPTWAATQPNCPKAPPFAPAAGFAAAPGMWRWPRCKDLPSGEDIGASADSAAPPQNPIGPSAMAQGGRDCPTAQKKTMFESHEVHWTLCLYPIVGHVRCNCDPNSFLQVAARVQRSGDTSLPG